MSLKLHLPSKAEPPTCLGTEDAGSCVAAMADRRRGIALEVLATWADRCTRCTGSWDGARGNSGGSPRQSRNLLEEQPA